MPDLRSELLDIERRADAATGEGWAVARSEDGEPSILVFHADGERTELRVTREVAPATAEDVEFIAHARDDIGVLLASWRTGREVAADTMAEISRRCEQASPGPLTASLDSDGGLGGCNLITVSAEDDQPDMYLWCKDQLAADADFVFVAGARQDIPRLLDGARNQQRGKRAVTALAPFASKWGLPVNPEDLEEMGYAVLVHADSSETHDEIDLAVRHHVISRHTLPLHSLADNTQELLAATRLMLNDIFNAFGRAEVTHVAQDGTLRLPYLQDPELAKWAEGLGVSTTAERLPE